ncbi:NACHT domain-containing protein [Micromonospora sp. DSM 115977]|uniref:NACHT domain-containing protein n=1 Tax=Micromonospora reichwaldensis TaxID=3075516 RepID=A0ABU2WP30_9ACTN|nr:NACHT domain-containing protein [Micromonospora sp. DSM 115977]MDT0527673.1 NACHT domain-containing protein [Micromonospora sp. DSM 115977]
MPKLPAGFEYATIGLAALAILIWGAKVFFSEGLKHAGQRFWPFALRSRRKGMRRRELRRYRDSVSSHYDLTPLGFLQNSSVRISDIYVPLQYEESGARADIYEDIRSRPRTVILGAAGAGKSMLLKNSMVKWSIDPTDHDRIPVLVELFRRNNGRESLLDLVTATLRRNGVVKPERFLPQALEEGTLSLFFDGLDEVLTEKRSEVVDEIESLAESYPECQFIVTCRDAVYDGDLRPVFAHEVRVAGFDDAAIRRFLRLWMLHKSEAADIRHEVEQLMASLRASPSLLILARSPLLLTMIASLQDADRGIGPVLTSSRSEFYEMAVWHLLRRDRDLGRHGEIAAYKAGHKLAALKVIAFSAQGAMAPGVDKRAIFEQELITQITLVLSRFNLEAEHAPKMLSEIEARSGLLVKVDEGNLLYEFPHLTLQEYLAAMELVDDADQLLKLYVGNPNRWRETVKLWCGGVHRDVTGLLRSIFEIDDVLALECLAEARQVDDALAQEILDHFEGKLFDINDKSHLVVAALGAVAADPGPRGSRLFQRLEDATKSKVPGLRISALHALAATRSRRAIEIISDQSSTSRSARSALRSMGEQAVPILTERAMAGSLDAVDDIAAVGTPSAAAALAEIVWQEGPEAKRAAWRLAELTDIPDVEEELASADSKGRASAEIYDWVWAPFVKEGTGRQSLAAIMGRTALLIDRSDPEDIPKRRHSPVDPRVSLPLAIRGIYSSKVSMAEFESITAEVNKLLPSPRDGSQMFRYRRHPEERLRELQQENPDAARSISDKFFAAHNVGQVHRQLLEGLPVQVVVEAVCGLLIDPQRATEKEWREVRKPVSAPVALEKINAVLTFALVAAVFLVGFAMVGGSALGLSTFWPRWVCLSLIGCLILLIVSVWLLVEGDSKGKLSTFMNGRFSKLPEYGLVPVSVFCVLTILVGIPIAFIYALSQGPYPLITLSSSAVALLLIVVMNRVISRRERMLSNPFRRLLAMDERVLRTRTSVIAPCRVGPPRQRSKPGTLVPK